MGKNFDIRLSTTKQLEKIIGKECLTGFDSECLEDDDPVYLLGLFNDFLKISQNELPNSSVKVNDNSDGFVLAVNGQNYSLEYKDLAEYVESNDLLYDFNLILEKNNSNRRVFYYWDYYDFGQEHGYFYAEKEFGIGIISLLRNPPSYSLEEFEGRNCNRIIKVAFKDSTTNEEVEYFKRLVADF